MFIDRVQLKVSAGNGGNGIVSFRREKFVAKGGPDGGDGGRGGHIILKVDPNLGTLLDLRYKPQLKAGHGRDGGGSRKTGRGGPDEIIRVPAGTVVIDEESGVQIGDLTEAGQEMIVARGGKGGKGNVHFKTSTRQAPRHATNGKPGQSKNLILELKLIADIGLVGLPNAGKSTLLSRVSAARPEIADYPFTTLRPHLGIVKAGGFDSFVMADIPGLIEGASEGKGLGHQFLRHIERTRILVILIDSLDPEPINTKEALLKELDNFNPQLLERPRIVVRSKSDLGIESWSDNVGEEKIEDLSISAVTGDGIDQLIHQLSKMVKEDKILE